MVNLTGPTSGPYGLFKKLLWRFTGGINKTMLIPTQSGPNIKSRRLRNPNNRVFSITEPY